MSRAVHVHPHVAMVRAALGVGLPIANQAPGPTTVAELLTGLAMALHTAHATCSAPGVGANPVSVGVGVLMRGLDPEWAARPPDEVAREPLDVALAHEAVARDHGFESWIAARGAGELDVGFEAAVEALVAGELETLDAALAARSELASQRSAFGHRATLMHYLAANGVEVRRQSVPLNAPALALRLLAAGADPSATARCYGGEWSVEALLESSAHPAAAGVADELLTILRRGGTGVA